MILVTGATGNVGSAVVRELLERGEPVRAFVRDPARSKERLDADVELAVGDFEDRPSLQRALEGVDRVFLSSADSPRKVDHETAVIDAAVQAGVQRIVKTSTVGAESGSTVPTFDWHGRIEDHVRRSGIPAVILHSSFYMTNILMNADAIKAQGKLFAPAGEGKIAMIDPRDTGAVGAALLSDGGAEGTHVLTGPQAVTFAQVAEELSAATGKRVEFVDVPEEALVQGLMAAGMPEWLVDHLPKVFRLIRQDAVAETTDGVRQLTGREPRTFAQFARDHAPLFGDSAG